MSTSRGNHNRSRPQKHQNKTAFKNDLHDTSKKTKFLNSLDVPGVCKRCKDIIDWKIKYKKYKPLTSPSKCVGCEEKAVKYAYHVLCGKCSKEKHVCAKCCKPADHEEIQAEEESNPNAEIQAILKTLPERKRRTFLRYMKKQENGNNTITSEDLLFRVNDMSLGDDDTDDFDYFSSDESDH